jgi:hypothetical protein
VAQAVTVGLEPERAAQVAEQVAAPALGPDLAALAVVPALGAALALGAGQAQAVTLGVEPEPAVPVVQAPGLLEQVAALG